MEATRVESKLYIKFNEEAENVDFTIFVPQGCNYENAKKGVIGAYEHIVRLEAEAVRLAQEKEKEEKVEVVVEAQPEPVIIEAEVAG